MGGNSQAATLGGVCLVAFLSLACHAQDAKPATQQVQTPGGSASGQMIRQEQIAPNEVLPNTPLQCTSTSSSCYAELTNQEIEIASHKLRRLLDQETRDYLAKSRRFRGKLSVQPPQELLTPLSAASLYEVQENTPKIMRVAFAKGSNDLYAFLLHECVMLEAGLNAINLSGLATLVPKVRLSILDDEKMRNADGDRHALSTADTMVAKLRSASKRLVVTPEIKSVPTGARLQIATRLQASQNRFAFDNETDKPGTKIYRGIYIYTISAPHFTTFSRELDLMDQPGNLIFCSPMKSQPSLSCEVR